MATAVLYSKREPNTEGLGKQCEVVAGPPHMTQDVAGKCTVHFVLLFDRDGGGCLHCPCFAPGWVGEGVYINKEQF